MPIRLHFLRAGLVGLLLLSAGAAPAADVGAPLLPADAPLNASDDSFADDTLKVGGYRWDGDEAAPGSIEIVISIPRQRAYVFEDGRLIGLSTDSSGRDGYDSPTGPFQILEKQRVHRSNRYDDAPMPYMMRLNWHGVAIHAGHVPNYPASHGCIRLPPKFAAKLFAAAAVGTFVYVTDRETDTPEAALDLARANADQPVPADRLPAGSGAMALAD